ncbi:PREDICTED: uncharacterized protein LOC104810456 [Tarenaya hassleriana]|uniref:uncharacterized protein LOC104810456 n=1 Tax=Tarenaya hassleriana TaxID=28532 RepID=UPI00053C3288|nr:PREDICTED: uncharacterized protein LOC104810456 [Tarenaya hassleriana]
MLVLQTHHRLFSFSSSVFPLPHIRRSHLLPLRRTPSSLSVSSPSALPRTRPDPVGEISDAAEEEDGPIELPPPSSSPFSSSNSIFATTDNPTPLQVATSVLLTGSISIFLFRSLRRRAKRAKELKFRSSGAQKTVKEEAMERLKTMGSAPIEAKKSPPSAAQAFLGAIAAGVIALILYKFATTIEAALNRQTISDNYSVRQITITVRTIINGLCYLATFVFGVNAVGLFLYSGQLAFNSMGDDGEAMEPKEEGSAEPDNSEVNSNSQDQK